MPDLRVEVVFASAEKQLLLQVEVVPGSTVSDVIANSRVLDAFPGHIRADLSIGIWGKPVADNFVVSDGDRVELYRKLELDPREARRQLALVGKTMNNAVLN